MGYANSIEERMGLLPQQGRRERADLATVREEELIESHKFHGRMTSRGKWAYGK